MSDKAPDSDLEGFAPLTTFCENVLFCHDFENNSEICIRYLQVFNMKNQIIKSESEKWSDKQKYPASPPMVIQPMRATSTRAGLYETNQIANMTIARQ